jgi:hypothetical protein
MKLNMEAASMLLFVTHSCIRYISKQITLLREYKNKIIFPIHHLKNGRGRGAQESLTIIAHKVKTCKRTRKDVNIQ